MTPAFITMDFVGFSYTVDTSDAGFNGDHTLAVVALVNGVEFASSEFVVTINGDASQNGGVYANYHAPAFIREP